MFLIHIVSICYMLLPHSSRLSMEEERIDKHLQQCSPDCSSVSSDFYIGSLKEMYPMSSSSENGVGLVESSMLDLSLNTSSVVGYNVTPVPFCVRRVSYSTSINSPDEKTPLKSIPGAASRKRSVLTFCCPSPVIFDTTRVYSDLDSVRPLKYDRVDGHENIKTKSPWLRLKGGLLYWCCRR